MGDDWPFHNLLLLGLLWLGILLYGAWRRGRPTLDQTTTPLTAPIQRRSREPRPFAGLLHKPRCDACEHAVEPRPQAPSAPPPILTFARGRRRQVDTQQQFCPDHDCAYYGWVGRGNIRANGHPGGKPWRQLQCLGCQGYFQETHGTPVHGKRVPPQMLGWAVGAVADGISSMM